MTVELLNKANENYNKKQGNDEHFSSLPEMMEMIDKMYHKIPSYNFPGIEECPNLDGYNVHYNQDDFTQFKNYLDSKTNAKEQSMIR
jgi:hypothetical protein